MTAEAELFLMNASRAQIVAKSSVRACRRRNYLCDRFYDSTTAYQGYGANWIWKSEIRH